MLDIALIAAIAENDAFGHKGAMPWRLKGELAIFKRITICLLYTSPSPRD